MVGLYSVVVGAAWPNEKPGVGRAVQYTRVAGTMHKPVCRNSLQFSLQLMEEHSVRPTQAVRI